MGMSPGSNSSGTQQQQQRRGGSKTAAAPGASAPSGMPSEARKRAHLRAAVRVLGRNTPEVAMPAASRGGRWRHALPPAPLADVSVRLVLKELNDIVDPPRKLPRFKVHLRRAPTQEVCVCVCVCWDFWSVWGVWY